MLSPFAVQLEAAVRTDTRMHDHRMPDAPSTAVLFEMLRSFTTLAKTLNLSQTCKILDCTRQTIRRHIDILEEIKGEKLFEVRDRQYSITEAGSRCVSEAEYLLNRCDAWLAGRSILSDEIDELERARYTDEQGHEFHAQQHPVNRIWIDSPPLLQRGLLAWSNARFQIEDPALELLKPYLLLYREYQSTWFCVSVGEKSSYASWHDWTRAKSAIGQPVTESPAGPEIRQFVTHAYTQVFHGGGARLDHIFARLSREKNGPLLPVSFQRLLMSCSLPDGGPVLASLVARTHRLDIPDLSPDKITSMPKDLVMEFDI